MNDYYNCWKNFTFDPDPPNMDWHSDATFREQIATLTPIDMNKNHVTLLRSFVQVCSPAAASFDPERPGADTFLAWQKMDEFVEKDHVRGFFHTHPAGVYRWSCQDIRAQNGLAKANGQMLLWHGVQAASSREVNDFGEPVIEVHGSEFVCSWMEHGRVFRYSYGMVDDYLDNPIITLPMPPALQWLDGAYVIDPQA